MEKGAVEECVKSPKRRCKMVLKRRVTLRRNRSSFKTSANNNNGGILKNGNASSTLESVEAKPCIESEAFSRNNTKSGTQNENDEDCILLDYDPCDSIKYLSLSRDYDHHITLVAEKGQVVPCRDFPHSRHQCATNPFGKTSHETYCKLCYCFVCDIAAPCKEWPSHCHATYEFGSKWWSMRMAMKGHKF